MGGALEEPKFFLLVISTRNRENRASMRSDRNCRIDSHLTNDQSREVIGFRPHVHKERQG